MSIFCHPGEWWYRHLATALGDRVPTGVFPLTLGSEPGYRWDADLAPVLGLDDPSTLLLGSFVTLCERLPTAPCRTAIWLDYWRHRPDDVTQAFLFDHVFVSAADGVAALRAAGCRSVSWLPYAFDESLKPVEALGRVFDVAFVGATNLDTHEPRRQLLRALAERYVTNDFSCPVYGHDLYRTYAQAKIVVNIPNCGSFNMRTFEAMGCGALLLTEDVRHGQEQLFESGRHLVTYTTRADLFDKIDYYLAHPAAREEVARRGQQAVLSHHTYGHRAATILAEMNAHGDEQRRTTDPDRISDAYAVFYHRHHRPDRLVRLLRKGGVSLPARGRVAARLARSLVAAARTPSAV